MLMLRLIRFVLPTLLVATLASGAMGQTNRAQALPGTRVALVDISKVFEQHKRFQAQMEVIKKQIADFDTQMQAEQKRLTDESQKLQQFKPGSAEYKRLEETLAQKVGDLRVQAQLKKKEVLESESRLYYDTYNEVLTHVRAICEHNGIGLVLRFDSADVDPTDRNSVLRGVNRPVVFQRQLDLTATVLTSVNR